MLSQNASRGYFIVTEKEKWIWITWEGLGVLREFSVS